MLHECENILVLNEKLSGVFPAPHWLARRLYIITGSSLKAALPARLDKRGSTAPVCVCSRDLGLAAESAGTWLDTLETLWWPSARRHPLRSDRGSRGWCHCWNSSLLRRKRWERMIRLNYKVDNPPSTGRRHLGSISSNKTRFFFIKLTWPLPIKSVEFATYF